MVCRAGRVRVVRRRQRVVNSWEMKLVYSTCGKRNWRARGKCTIGLNLEMVYFHINLKSLLA